MKTIEINTWNYGIQEVKLNSVRRMFNGYGHFRITAEILFKGKSKIFSEVINDMPSYDEVMDLEDYEEQQIALYELIEDDILEEIRDFIEDVLDEE